MSALDQNPYSTPAFASLPALPNGYIFRDGKFLIIRSGAMLPEICPVENVPLPPPPKGGCKTRQISWTPPWAYALVLCGVLFGLILIVILQKKGTITYGLGPKAKGRVRTRRMIGTGLLLASGGCVFGLVEALKNNGSLAGPFTIAAIVLIIAALFVFTLCQPLTVIAHRNPAWFKLKGCSPAFLDTLEEVSFKTLS